MSSISVLLWVALLAPAAFAQSYEKPSPVPSRVRKMPARPLPAPAPVTPIIPDASAPAAPVWTPAAPSAAPSWDGKTQTGTSVFFSNNARGKKADSGIIINPDEMIAAHASIPFGTQVKITNLKNGKEAIVRIVDRISASSSHIISVSERAASELDYRRAGIGSVRITPADKP
jgi:rare lipoprotein A